MVTKKPYKYSLATGYMEIRAYSREEAIGNFKRTYPAYKIVLVETLRKSWLGKTPRQGYYKVYYAPKRGR